MDNTPPPARRTSSPAVSTEPPAYSSRFQITTPDSTPSRCCCQVDPPSEPPVFTQDTFQKGTFLHIYSKYRRIAVDFIYIYSSKNTIFHKNAYNTVYIEKTYIYKNSHFFKYYQKTHIYKKHHFVKIRVFLQIIIIFIYPFFRVWRKCRFSVYGDFPDIWEIAVLTKSPIFRTT